MEDALRKVLKKHKVLAVDTSILIYHFEDVAPYSAFTEALFSALARGEVEVVASTLCVAEFLVKPWERGKSGEALKHLLGIPNMRYVAPGVEVAAEAARLRAAYGLRTPDALHLTTAKAAGATAFLTNDRDLRKVMEGVDILVLDELLTAS